MMGGTQGGGGPQHPRSEGRESWLPPSRSSLQTYIIQGLQPSYAAPSWEPSFQNMSLWGTFQTENITVKELLV